MDKSAKGQAVEQLRRFVVSRRTLVREAEFQGDVARVLWSSVAPTIGSDLDRLLKAVAYLRVENQEQVAILDDLLWRAEETVEWAKGSELEYIEALLESHKALDERLNEEGLVLVVSAAVAGTERSTASRRVDLPLNSLAGLLNPPPLRHPLSAYAATTSPGIVAVVNKAPAPSGALSLTM